MSSVKKPFDSEEDLDADIEYYSSLTDEQIDAELARLNVDATSTVEAVNKLVQAKLAEWGLAQPGLNKH